MFTKSIYFKMTAWYVLVLGLILGTFSLFLYSHFSHALNKDYNILLKSKAEDIEQVISSYREEDKSERGEKKESSIPTSTDFLNALRYAVEQNPSDKIFVQIFSPDGKEILHSSNMPLSVILAKMAQDSIAGNKPYFATIKIALLKKKVFPLRTFTLPAIGKGSVSYIIQVSGSLKPIYFELNRLKVALFIFLPLAILLVIRSGVFLTKMALRPVDNMTNAIRQITSKNLHQTIELPEANDEIKRLAETFNTMLIRLNQAFSSQQQLIQDVSHELKTPLTALKGKQEVVLNKKRSPEEYESVLSVNLEEINKMSQLVENLLVLARIENKDYVLKTESINLADTIEQIISSMRPLADQKKILLRFSSIRKIFIQTDADQINRVISNIIDNAIKYTPSKGEVDIKLEKENTFAKIIISDTGIGIVKDELHRIFDRFYRIDKSRSSPGFGLGLSIAKSIIDAHKGRIEVESLPGKGTAFTVFLPLVHP
jgi:heavy metal sensor kinase